MSGLTVEDAAAVSAFVQELHNAAQGGSPLDEETLALRMLAAANADADFDPSHISSPLPANGTARVALDAGSDKFDAFASLLLGDLESPKEQVDKGMVPKPPPVIVEDPIGDSIHGYDEKEAGKNFAYVKDAQSVCQMFMNIMLMKTNPGGFDITKDAAAAFNVQAKLAYNAMAGPMAGIYSFSQGAHTSQNLRVPKSETHETLFKTMFHGMRLGEDHEKEIDSQVTNFVKSLKDVKVGGTGSTVDFALRFGLVPTTNITGDPSHRILNFVPTTYVVYLKMDATAFTESISKNNSRDYVDLKYEHVVTKFELNVDRFLKMRPKYDEMFQMATKMSLKEYSDRLNKAVQEKK